MTPLLLSALLVATAYFLGSIPTGVLMARARGVDITAVGSGNIGATNVARSIGKRLGVLVLVLDALKGALPVLAAMALARRPDIDPFVVTAVGFAAIGGHCFPVWLGFHGGKGVATSLGVFVVLAPLVTVFAVAIWIALYLAFHVASIGSMVAAASYVPLLLALDAGDEIVALSVIVALLIVFTHRANIGRLLRHEEHRV